MRRTVSLPLAAILLAAPLSAGAAAASGPDALPAQAAGVVGSGDQLALQLKPVGDGPARTLHLGDAFEDGWVLSALTPSTATLTKAGAARTVGLNPGGVVANATVAPIGGAAVTVNQPARPPTPQGVLDAQAELARANAAYAAATPETRQAALNAVNAARMGLINAQNDVLRAQNEAIAASLGLPPPPPAPKPVAGMSVAQAQAQLDQARAAFDASTPANREDVQRALQAATIQLNASRLDAANAALRAAQ